MKLKGVIVLILGVFISLISVTALYPLMYKDHVNKYSKTYEIDPFLVMAVIRSESSFDENATSKKDARGLMQISDKTGNWAAESLLLENYNKESLYDPETNIRIGTWYLNKLINQFQDIEVALAAYNAGSGNVQSWLGDKEFSQDGKTLKAIPFNETRDYISKVQKSYDIYTKIYWHPYFLDNDNRFDNVFVKTREIIIKIARKLR